MDRSVKITFGELREMGLSGVLICCADHTCSHSVAISAEQWDDDVRLSDIDKPCPRSGHGQATRKRFPSLDLRKRLPELPAR